eukprot:TRINITY_DN77901_c0_g1_i1.p1 TRINITY_DN77901_c0_g1~~TRINITY_DN77901_c0_g1_i1.p1  ORF type:complete len:410 (+),score=70.98 TRINITY_DN77901_c0_g1_i1:48-1277(+)
MWQSSFSHRPADGAPRDQPESQLERDQKVAAELNERFEKGLIVKIIASPPGGTEKTGFDKKISQLLGLRHGRQPEQEGYNSVGWNLQEWPRCAQHESGKGIAGNWFTSGSFVNAELAGPYRPYSDGDNDQRETGTSLYGCNRYACGRTLESHKVLAVFQPNPIVGCGYVEDAGTNQAGPFTGCASDWKGVEGDYEASRCLDSPDCTFKLQGNAFGGSGKGVWRVDRKFFAPNINHFSGRFDPEAEGTKQFISDQIRFNPKVSPQQVSEGVRHHTMGYNEVMVQVGTPAMLFEEMQKQGLASEPKWRFNTDLLRLWQCRTNGIAAFARLRPPPASEAMDDHTRQVENCRYEVFRKMRDGYDMACGRSQPTPILFFDMAAHHNPFSAHEVKELFPSQGPCDSSKARPLNSE